MTEEIIIKRDDKAGDLYEVCIHYKKDAEVVSTICLMKDDKFLTSGEEMMESAEFIDWLNSTKYVLLMNFLSDRYMN